MDDVTKEGCKDGHKYNLLEEATFACMGCGVPMDGGTLSRMSLNDGDTLLVSVPPHLSEVERQQLRTALTTEIETTGKKVILLMFPMGVEISKMSEDDKSWLRATLNGPPSP